MCSLEAAFHYFPSEVFGLLETYGCKALGTSHDFQLHKLQFENLYIHERLDLPHQDKADGRVFFPSCYSLRPTQARGWNFWPEEQPWGLLQV